MVIKTNIILEIKCKNLTEINLLSNVISPENKLLDNRTEIIVTYNGDKLLIKIKSAANTSSVKYILDDILFTIELVNKVRLMLE